MSTELTLTDLDKVARRLQTMARTLPNVVGRALYNEAEVEMLEAKRRTPVDTDALRGSGHVTEPAINGRDVSVQLAFGGAAAPYAVIVHEDLDALHSVGQAKYLESTIMESAPYLAKRIARRIVLDEAAR